MELGFGAWAELAGAVSVPLIAVVALFYQMLRHTVKPITDELKDIARDVHSLDTRLARVEETLRHVKTVPV